MSVSRTLIQNAVFVPETNTYYKSTHVHDFVQIDFEDGLYYCVDGGPEYRRRVGDLYALAPRVVDMCLYQDDPFDLIARRLLWGTYGKEGDLPRRWVPLYRCETDHLKAILETQLHIKGGIVEKVVKYILKERGK